MMNQESWMKMSPNSLSEVLKKGISILAEAGIEEAGLDAWLLLEYETKITRGYYLAHTDELMDDSQIQQYFDLVRRRSERIPLQHLTNQAWFMGYEFFVNEHVLIPRQDTECLVERALQILKNTEHPHILDMCTGSGCILLSILSERVDAIGQGCDLSEEALEVAYKNAGLLGVEKRAHFSQGNLFEAGCFFKNDSRNTVIYDMIISNPPYIATPEIERLQDEVKLHDPRMALDGKEDGLFFYRQITKDAKDYLKSGGFLLYEIGYDQGESVSEIMKTQGFLNVKVEKDLAGLDRVVYGIKS